MGSPKPIQLDTINARYSSLAESNCCLSCGGALERAAVKHGETCVDLGSGRGSDALRMADLVGPGGFVYGVDVSDGMLEKARATAKKFGVTNVAFVKSELEKLPLDDDSADVVISNCTINHAPDKRRVWKEIYRVMKKGGRFIVSDIYSTAPVPDRYRNDPQAVAECWAGSVTRDEYLEGVRAAGFSDVTILEESAPYAKGAIEVVSWTISANK